MENEKEIGTAEATAKAAETTEAAATEADADIAEENEISLCGVPKKDVIDDIFRLRRDLMHSDRTTPGERLRAAADLERMMSDTAAGGGSSPRFELPARVVGKAFSDINRRIVPNVSYAFAGGRGSGKSSFVAMKILELMLGDPLLHACVVRRYASTLRDSVFAQLEWAAGELGVYDAFVFNKSPLEITLRATGQTVYFRGCDDAAKLKSIKPPFGYIGILWKEELDQLSGPEEERSLAQSILRGGPKAYDFSTYNPPRSRKSWVNAPAADRVVHKSTYLDMPPEWLGQKFLDDAEHLKKTCPAVYEHEYLGVPNGDGGQVFERLDVRTISDEEAAAAADRARCGVDFGWFPDSYAFVRAAYFPDREEIMILDELYGQKLSNEATGAYILSHGFADRRVVCDSAEPKSIAEYRAMGIPAVPSAKGPGSVAHGFRWLAARKIIVDPRRTPATCRELVGCEYARDRDGAPVGFPTTDDHAIAALRYAFEGDMRGSRSAARGSL